MFYFSCLYYYRDHIRNRKPLFEVNADIAKGFAKVVAAEKNTNTGEAEAVDDKSVTSDGFRRLQFLYVMYEPVYWYWEVIIFSDVTCRWIAYSNDFTVTELYSLY